MKNYELSQLCFNVIDYFLDNEDNFTVTEEKQQERMEICQGCEEFVEKRQMCLECGCYLPNKTSGSFAKCPLKKWEADPSKWNESDFENILNNIGELTDGN